MRINSAKLNQDLTGEVRIPNCPSMYRKEAERIIGILLKEDVPKYNKMTQFDMWLICQIWVDDGVLIPLNGTVASEWRPLFISWVMSMATPPENIRRARQWLVENNYLFPKSDVAERAQEASKHWRQGAKR